jgi:hypothetical protein
LEDILRVVGTTKLYTKCTTAAERESIHDEKETETEGKEKIKSRN